MENLFKGYGYTFKGDRNQWNQFLGMINLTRLNENYIDIGHADKIIGTDRTLEEINQDPKLAHLVAINLALFQLND